MDLPFLSSQGSLGDQEQIIPSSPPGPRSELDSIANNNGGSSSISKPKKPPTITPRRFTKFFTPVSALSSRRQTGKSGRQLRDITRNAINIRGLHAGGGDLAASQDMHQQTPRKRQKTLPTPESSPVQLLSSPCAPQSRPPLRSHSLFEEEIEDSCVSDVAGSDVEDECRAFPAPVSRLRQAGPSSRLLQRSFGGRKAVSRGRVVDHGVDWQASTANFYSGPDDTHSFRGSALPFCVTPCNSNSLVAIGDEEGGIRLVDSQVDLEASFSKPHVSFRPHHNAVMDIAFSSDDYLFATASGDQTARIIDMRTQQTRYIMAGHMSSVKQVRFQPGNDSIVATSSRDGSVQIWDLRCRGSEASVADFNVNFEPGNDYLARPSPERKVIYATTCLSIRDAHANTLPAMSHLESSKPANPRALFSRNDSSSSVPRRNDVSITALSFLPDSRSHLLLTACEANASIKLWDLRSRPSRNNGPAIPLSSVPSPTSHIKHRHFGINSLALSGNASRLYAVCRDSTVYAYSTDHLILGHAPEFDGGRAFRRSPKNALGPLYGFRHPQFHATSFYVKAAVRPASGDREEMLAVGSRDSCAVVIPTDETFLPKPESPEDDLNDLPSVSVLRKSVTKPWEDAIPIYNVGTSLVRGHSSEVTSVSWTHGGNLVTLSDDFQARCWREDANKARDLRTGGEAGGRRWACGWSDMPSSWDEDE